jgi:hypothetical protein
MSAFAPKALAAVGTTPTTNMQTVSNLDADKLIALCAKVMHNDNYSFVIHHLKFSLGENQISHYKITSLVSYTNWNQCLYHSQSIIHDHLKQCAHIG